MNDITLSPRQLDLVKRTVAADCNAEEFSLFSEVVRRLNLDPFRRQVMALIFNKKNPEKRRMSIVVGLDGQRILAQRCGNYRPASEPATFVYNSDLIGPLNPLGIVSCTVYLHVQDKGGDWYPVVGEARWDEYAPLSDEWAYDEEKGKRLPTGSKTLDPLSGYVKMPYIMMTKCATMQALRAGWPDQFAGIYSEEEMERAKVADLDANAAVEVFAEEQRMKQISADNSITVSWLPGMPLEMVPVGSFADRVVEWMHDPSHTVKMIMDFREVNRVALQQFWAAAPGDALALKQEFEKRLSITKERDPAELHPLEAG